MVMAVAASIPVTPTTASMPTDAVRQDNEQRQQTPPIVESQASARESGVGGDSDRGLMSDESHFAYQLVVAKQEADWMRHRAQDKSEASGVEIKDIEAEDIEEENTENKIPQELTEAEQKEVQELKERDAEVRQHEQTHANIAGQYAGSPQYEFERGPDGNNYAVGGHVEIDTSPIANDPEATVLKMQTIRRAALSVDEPSAADRQIAQQAQQEESKAQQELNKQD